MNERTKIWVEAGLAEFARYGPEGFKVEHIAAKVGKSRSSYYHLFGDVEGFRDAVYEYHYSITAEFSRKLADLDSFHPGFSRLMFEYKDWAFARIQMYNHKDLCVKCTHYFDKSSELIEEKITCLWAGMTGREHLPIQRLKELYRIVWEAVYLDLRYDTFSPELFYDEIRSHTEALDFLFEQAG